MAISISREKVIDNWSAFVERGAGKDTWLMNTTEQHIKDMDAPSIVCAREDVSSGLFSTRRSFIVVTHRGLRDYMMFINARDFGQDLDVSWFLTINPGFLKKTISKYVMGNPQALSMNIDVFAQQDLAAYTTMAHHCLQRAIQQLMEELKQDYSKIDRKSKGFLSVW